MLKTPFHLLKTQVAKSKKIAILTHWSPDGDAIGSSLGLYHYLKKKGKNVRVIVPNDYPSFLAWMPGNKSILNFQKDSKKVVAFLKNVELIFTLDFNSYSRIENLGELVMKNNAKKILIDHHRQPDKFADYYYHDIYSSSTAELIYEFIVGIDSKRALTKNISTCLYTGIMTDSGNFRFPSTKPSTHKVVAELMEKGACNHEIYNSVFDESSVSKLKLLGYCLSEKLIVLPELNAAVIALSEEEQDKFNYIKGDTEGVVNYPLSIKGIRFSIFMAERDGIVKMSFRSKGNFDVNLFARKYFSGGGHKNAAGGKSDETLKSTLDYLLKILPNHKKELQTK